MGWDGLAQGYHKSLSSKRGRPAKDARLVIGAVIIKHKLGLSDRETVSQIQENPYLQYFVGLASYQRSVPFVPSLLVEVRKRMGDAELLCRFGKCSIKRLLVLWKRRRSCRNAAQCFPQRANYLKKVKSDSFPLR